MASLAPRQGVELVVFDEISIEPTDGVLPAAAGSPLESQVGRLRFGRWRVGHGNLQSGQPVRLLSRRFHDVCERADRRGTKGPRPGQAAHCLPDDVRTGSETTGIAIFNLQSMNAKTGIISRRLIPDRRAQSTRTSRRTLPAKMVAATGFDCMSHALEAITARAYPRGSVPRKASTDRFRKARIRFPTSLAGEALGLVGRFLPRAVADAADVEARTK
jgi:alcohol dehydrogenase class IV